MKTSKVNNHLTDLLVAFITEDLCTCGNKGACNVCKLSLHEIELIAALVLDIVRLMTK